MKNHLITLLGISMAFILIAAHFFSAEDGMPGNELRNGKPARNAELELFEREFSMQDNILSGSDREGKGPSGSVSSVARPDSARLNAADDLMDANLRKRLEKALEFMRMSSNQISDIHRKEKEWRNIFLPYEKFDQWKEKKLVPETVCLTGTDSDEENGLKDVAYSGYYTTGGRVFGVFKGPEGMQTCRVGERLSGTCFILERATEELAVLRDRNSGRTVKIFVCAD